jgi:hypothetical protein
LIVQRPRERKEKAQKKPRSAREARREERRHCLELIRVNKRRKRPLLMWGRGGGSVGIYSIRR